MERVILIAALLVMLGASAPARAQSIDVCGCAGNPESLGDFVSSDEASWPLGTTLSGSTIVMPLPEDGVMIFDSFVLDGLPGGGDSTLRFTRNEANSPVRILVAGDFTIGSGDTLSVRGDDAESGNGQGIAGRGGLGGPGGWKGGDGGFRFGSESGYGGAGLGPGGGSPGAGADWSGGAGGSFVGAADLLPISGGSGGGGGSSQRTATNAACGGGAGGGGAILIAADGSVSVEGAIVADGGLGGERASGNAAGGGGGSGGAVRIVANAIQGGGSVFARGGGGRGFGAAGTAGRIIFEAFSNGLSVSSSRVSPVAIRRSLPGPATVALAPNIAITAIDGAEILQPPVGWRGSRGSVDVLVPVPGVTTVEFETSGVPEGTLVDVKVVPRIGGDKVTQSVLLGTEDCNTSGICSGFASVDLAAGNYVIEARATFQPPAGP